MRKSLLCLPGGLIALTLISGLFLVSTKTSADDTAIDTVKITVPETCTLQTPSGTGEVYNESMMNGQYKNNIGDTEFTVKCNTEDSFSIYAIGYSDDEYGNTNMINSSSTAGNIATGTATSGNTSNWAMKLTAVSGSPMPTIDNGYNNFSVVPDRYTKVASIPTSMNPNSEAKVKSTYAVYISPTQSSGSYTGKVKYTVVHPSSENPKDDPRFVGSLDTGLIVNQKLKRLAGNSSAILTTDDNNITALIRSDTLPSGFTPTAENTISTTNSGKPIYAWYDSANKTIYYYSEATNIKMNQISNCFFCNMRALSDLSTISSWDTSSVTSMTQMFSSAGYNATTFTLDLSSWDTSSVMDMSYMFNSAGSNATTWSVGDLSSWDTSSVTNMSYMFYSAGGNTTTWSVGDLSSWDTSSVKHMDYMFRSAGYNATTFTLDLSSWNTSSVTDMSGMFYFAGRFATTFTLDLSSWDTSSVTNMSAMFREAGYNTTTWSIGDLSSWDTSSVTNMSYMFSYAGYKATTFTLDLSSWDASSVTNMYQMFNSAGYSATTWSVTIPKTNKGSTPITNTTTEFYGSTTSVYAIPLSGKTFTLAD